MMVIPHGPPAQRRYHLDKLEAQVNGSFMESAANEGAPLPTAPLPLTSDEVDSPPDASPKEEDVSNSDTVPSPEKSRQTSPQGYQCKLCTLVASSQCALEEHMNIHNGSRPYHCLECGFSCSLQSSLTQHLATHHPKDLNETPSYENNLRERLKEQSLTESAPTAATTTASQNDTLPTSGMVTSPVTTAAPPLQQLPGLPAGIPPQFHTDHSKAFQCKLCTHVSPTKTHLNEHMNIHTGKKPYKCLVCGFSSAFRSSLMRHLIVHTGTSKQYKCDQCHYQTPYKCNLQAHRRKRHGNAGDLNSYDVGDNYRAPSHHATSPIHNNPNSLIGVQDASRLMAHIGENNIDMRNRYSALSAEALNSLSHSAAAVLNSGNRPQPPSPNGSNTSASNDAQEMFIHKNSIAGSESGDHPPMLGKTTPNSNESDPKDMMEFTGATSINNDMPVTTSPTGPLLNTALSRGPLGLPPVTLPPGVLPPSVTSPHGEISVITPLHDPWASGGGAGFPIFRRKKEGGARKRKRTPVPKREFLVSPTGEDISDPWADNGRDSASANGDSQSEVYRSMAREFAMKGEHGAVNGGLDLSRDSSFADQDLGNDVSPSSCEVKEEGMNSPESPPTGDGLLLTRSTQTEPSSSSQSQSQDPLASQLNKCPHCETYFADHVIFTLHMSCHGRPNPYQCSICDYPCRDKIEFTCHITRSQHRT